MTMHRCTSRECIIVFLCWFSPSRPWVKHRPFSELVLHQEPGHPQISSHMWRAVATVLYTRPLLVPGRAALVRQRAKHLLRNHLARRALPLADTSLRKKVIMMFCHWLSNITKCVCSRVRFLRCFFIIIFSLACYHTSAWIEFVKKGGGIIIILELMNNFRYSDHVWSLMSG